MKGGIARWVCGPVHGPVQSKDVPGTSPPLDTAVVDSVIPPMDLQDEKPITSCNGVSMAIHLGEPVLFLQDFENAENAPGNTAILRGSLHLRVQKSAKINAVTLKFKGKAVNRCLGGIHLKGDSNETEKIKNHTWPFFNARFQSAESGSNADHVQLFTGPRVGPTSETKRDPLGWSFPNAAAGDLTVKEATQLALHANKSRSFGKCNGGPYIAAKGYRNFLPGDYIYNFELPLDSRLPETMDIKSSSVKYELEALVERSGVFQTNLVGNKEVTLIRVPAEGSLRQVEPIAISRNWEDHLHYELIISGRSFPLGSQVPIALKMTPLAKVQCHRIKVFMTENIKHCSNNRVHCVEPAQKVQLFDKRADGSPVSTFSGSSMRITAGGGIPYDARAGVARGEDVVPQNASNLLGNLEGDTNVGPTEMQFNVQLPSCHTMTEKEGANRLHPDTKYKNIRVNHWINIVLTLSKPDQNHPGKRRHSEISIESPFHILSCRATQANISLPAYNSHQVRVHGVSLYECGCPGAARQRNSPTSFLPTLNALNSARTGDGENPGTPTIQSPGLARPQEAHIHGPPAAQRPIHMLRTPSFNPPEYEDEVGPPAVITPPPQYDDIASPTHGLNDYVTRLSDIYDSDTA